MAPAEALSPSPADASQAIELKMSVGMKLVCGLTVLGCAGFVLALLPALWLALAGDASLPGLGGALLGLAFFGGGGWLMLRLLVRDAGRLCLRADGLLLDTYFCGGLIAWRNIEAIDKVRIGGMGYLGIRLHDLDAFVASGRAGGLTHLRDRAMTNGFVRLMLMAAPSKLFNPLMALLGYTRLPDSPSEADLLKWNHENSGYHVCIQAFWLPALDALIERLRAQVAARGAVEPSQAVAGGAGDAEMKTCPMCAEPVRARARVPLLRPQVHVVAARARYSRGPMPMRRLKKRQK